MIKGIVLNSDYFHRVYVSHILILYNTVNVSNIKPSWGLDHTPV